MICGSQYKSCLEVWEEKILLWGLKQMCLVIWDENALVLKVLLKKILTITIWNPIFIMTYEMS